MISKIHLYFVLTTTQVYFGLDISIDIPAWSFIQIEGTDDIPLVETRPSTEKVSMTE